MIYGKIWGNTECIFHRNDIALHRIYIKQGGASSKHCHVNKYNQFFIEKGKIKILVWQQKYELIDETILMSGQSMVVDPGYYHQFIAIEETVAYEIYYVSLDDNDIIRDGVGYIRKNLD